MVERTRIEKEQKLKSDQDVALLRKTIKMLSDHIEKLMSHLKHEATAKIALLQTQRTYEKRIVELEELTSTLTKKNAAKDRLILELREGSKILEDQLRLMDDKFLELRSKLDWVRENDEKKTKKAIKEASELRAKIATLHMVSRTHTSSLPDINDATTGMYLRDSSTGNTSRNHDDIITTNETNKKKKKKDKKEPTIDSIIDKLRKQNDAKVEWTEERARDLVKQVPRKY
jgi:DNA repair exonuclease SbcCD ATPase subunit